MMMGASLISFHSVPYFFLYFIEVQHLITLTSSLLQNIKKFHKNSPHKFFNNNTNHKNNIMTNP